MAFEDSVMSASKASGDEAAAKGAEMMVDRLLSEMEGGARIQMEMFCFVAQKAESRNGVD